VHPSASFSATLRVRLANHPGAFARLAATIGEAGGLLGAIDLVRVEGDTKLRDVNVLADDEAHLAAIVAAVRAGGSADVVRVSDRTFLAHLGGKLEIRPRLPLKPRDDLSMAYTPGVARVSRAIAEEPDDVWNLTIKRNTVAVVSDGSAVLGLGNIGPEAALPVMEGKAVLFKEFRERRRVPALPRDAGSGRDRARRAGDRTRVRRHQPRGHLCPTLLRHRATPA
jgi:malate dehydrogenase (oxaloacetate-decarboxylating)